MEETLALGTFVLGCGMFLVAFLGLIFQIVHYMTSKKQ